MMGRLRAYRDRVAGLRPEGMPEVPSIVRRWQDVQGVAVLAWLDLNDALIQRFASPPEDFAHLGNYPWIADLESAAPTIAREVTAYLRDRTAPETAELIGARPIGAGDNASVPSGEGSWRILLLQSFGRPVDGVAVHFPETMKAIRRVPIVGNIGFTCLDAHSRIDDHRDVNRGVLRLQLPLRVPADPTRCWLRVGDVTVAWVEGRCLLFDQCVPHEARNDTDHQRILLTAEVMLTVPFPLSAVNRIAQRSYRRLPSYAGMVERAALAATRPAAAAS